MKHIPFDDGLPSFLYSSEPPIISHWIGSSGTNYGIDRAIDRGDQTVYTTYRVCDYCGVPIILPQSKHIIVVTELCCPCCGAPVRG